jgi:hypothetical protein
LKYRLYDIDRIISRTLAYAIVTGLLAGVYAGLVLLAAHLLPRSSSAGVAVATLVAAALFSPLRRRVQRVVDHRFNRAATTPTRPWPRAPAAELGGTQSCGGPARAISTRPARPALARADRSSFGTSSLVMPSMTRTSIVAVMVSGCMNGVMPPLTMVPDAEPAVTRGLRADDMFRLSLVADPRLSAGGRFLAYVRGYLDREADRVTGDVVVTDLESGDGRYRRER